MIELFERRLPMDKRKILAIVFEVAAYAITAVGIRHPEKRVVTLMRRQAAGNFLVTFEAFERGRAGSELHCVEPLRDWCALERGPGEIWARAVAATIRNPQKINEKPTNRLTRTMRLRRSVALAKKNGTRFLRPTARCASTAVRFVQN
jgi:hypothetical protein